MHWVHTSCDSDPGEGLGACVPDTCTDPVLRVEAQTFLVVNDANALDFTTMGYQGFEVNGLDRAKMIPSNTGTPVVFRGSTTGPSDNESVCSPAKVTWSVRPQCAKLDINSLHRWAEAGNVFNETESHGVRQLVTSPELLSPIQKPRSYCRRPSPCRPHGPRSNRSGAFCWGGCAVASAFWCTLPRLKSCGSLEVLRGNH